MKKIFLIILISLSITSCSLKQEEKEVKIEKISIWKYEVQIERIWTYKRMNLILI